MPPLTKSDRTRKRIIETSAPIFNKKGYAGTSISDIIQATGLTKGGIYGNFSGKDELAIEVFEFNKDRLFLTLHEKVSEKNSPLGQLHAFFRTHGVVIRQFANGCPLLNTAMEADDTHPALKKRVKAAIFIWINYLKNMIRKGMNEGEIRDKIDPEFYARMFISMLEGAVFMGKLTDTPEAYLEVTRQIHKIIDQELKVI